MYHYTDLGDGGCCHFRVGPSTVAVRLEAPVEIESTMIRRRLIIPAHESIYSRRLSTLEREAYHPRLDSSTLRTHVVTDDYRVRRGLSASLAQVSFRNSRRSTCPQPFEDPLVNSSLFPHERRRFPSAEGLYTASTWTCTCRSFHGR